MALIRVALPWRKNKKATFCDSIKESIRGFKIISETVIGKVDNKMTLFKKDGKNVTFMSAYKRRDHDRALASREDTAVHVVAERLRIAEPRFLVHLMADMDGLSVFVH